MLNELSDAKLESVDGGGIKEVGIAVGEYCKNQLWDDVAAGYRIIGDWFKS